MGSRHTAVSKYQNDCCTEEERTLSHLSIQSEVELREESREGVWLLGKCLLLTYRCCVLSVEQPYWEQSPSSPEVLQRNGKPQSVPLSLSTMLGCKLDLSFSSQTAILFQEKGSVFSNFFKISFSHTSVLKVCTVTTSLVSNEETGVSLNIFNV